MLAACETAAPLASAAAEAAAAAAHAARRVAPVGALKRKKTGGAKAGSVAESLARLSAQRDNEAGEKESARMVTALATKADQEGRPRLAQTKAALEQRRAEEEQRDREQARRQKSDESMLGMMVQMRSAGITMEEFLAGKAAYMDAQPRTGCVLASTSTRAPSAEEAEEDAMENSGHAPPPAPAGSGAAGPSVSPAREDIPDRRL